MKEERRVFLTTQDLDLVMIKKEDANQILRWFHDPEVNQFLNNGEFPLTTEFEEKYIVELYEKQSKLQLGIYHREDKKLIGTAGIHNIHNVHLQGSFGIAIGDQKYWGEGYGEQTLKAMLDWSFKIRGLRTITLDVLGNNPRGKRCYEKCGFVQIGVIPKSVFKQGEWHDRNIMILQNPSIKY